MAAGGSPLLFLPQQKPLRLPPIQWDGLAERDAGHGRGIVAGHDAVHNRRREAREPHGPRHERLVQAERAGQF